MAIASSAMEMRSPAVSSMSSSRPGGSAVIWLAWSSSSSVVSPMAETTTTTSSPFFFASTMRSATRLTRSAFATEEPPYFCTTKATGPGYRRARGRSSLAGLQVPEQRRRRFDHRMTRVEDWLLTDAERGNPSSGLPAWTSGNLVEPLVHGAAYFDRLVEEVEAVGAGDHLFFTDWRLGPHGRMREDGPTVAELFTRAPRRGVCLRGLVWRSHWD